MHYMYISNAIKPERTSIMRQKIRTNKFLKTRKEEEKSEKKVFKHRQRRNRLEKSMK